MAGAPHERRTSREPGRRRSVLRAAGAGLVVAALASLAGCAGAPTVTRQAEARVAVQADCLDPQVVHELGLVLEDRTAAAEGTGPAATPGAVPEDFAPSSVLVCSASGTLKSASGTWAAVTESRREGDLAPLLAALERPSQEPSGACETSGAVPTVLWLVDALGRAVRPVWPTDACGAPVADVLAALDALRETDTTEFPVERVTPTGPPSGR